MAIVPFPRDILRSAAWSQARGRALVQQSAFSGRSRQLDFGVAARWQAECEPIPAFSGSDQALAIEAFEAACQLPGNHFRLPAGEAGQHGPTANLVGNSELEFGTAGWIVPSDVIRLASNGSLLEVENVFIALGGSARSIEANSGSGVAVTPGETILFQTWAYRHTAANTAVAVLNWRDVGGIDFGSAGIVLNPAVGQWVYFAIVATVPASAATARIRYDVDAAGAGFAGLGGLWAGRVPRRAAVDGAANAGRTLSLSGLGPNLLNLRAGQFLTVLLPGGDEQLVRLAADLIANGSGLGAASLVSPLRRTPEAAAAIELDKPWGLMRATHAPGWNVEPGAVRGYRLACEEAF
jgi:hypothetical protein